MTTIIFGTGMPTWVPFGMKCPPMMASAFVQCVTVSARWGQCLVISWDAIQIVSFWHKFGPDFGPSIQFWKRDMSVQIPWSLILTDQLFPEFRPQNLPDNWPEPKELQPCTVASMNGVLPLSSIVTLPLPMALSSSSWHFSCTSWNAVMYMTNHSRKADTVSVPAKSMSCRQCSKLFKPSCP